MNEENQTVSGNEIEESNNEVTDNMDNNTVSAGDVPSGDEYDNEASNDVDISGNDILSGNTDVIYGDEVETTESALSEETLAFYDDVTSGISETNNLLAILLFFTVFVWVEKKIKNAVGKVMKNE